MCKTSLKKSIKGYDDCSVVHFPKNVSTQIVELSIYKEIQQTNGLTIEDIIKKFGKLDVDPISVESN